MREIKFRGKRVDNGKWVYGNIQVPKPPFGKYFMWEKHLQVEVIPETVGQFTGLKDKNGVEIYEGDMDENNDVVMWCERRSGWSLNVYDFEDKEHVFCHCYECEGNFDIYDTKLNIVGNIYDN